MMFQCSSTSRNCRNRFRPHATSPRSVFQCSSTSRNCRNQTQTDRAQTADRRFSALQRAEIAEISSSASSDCIRTLSFSALQRAEIAEITEYQPHPPAIRLRFSALQRAEIAEMMGYTKFVECSVKFQCSSTSRNCRNIFRSQNASMCFWVSVLFNEPKLPKYKSK